MDWSLKLDMIKWLLIWVKYEKKFKYFSNVINIKEGIDG